MGISSNSLFGIGPRQSGKKIVRDKTFKAYKIKKNDTVAVTALGYMPGLDLGGICLYDKLGLNAKTSLPSLGDGLLGLDVSEDGRLLATCKTYLLWIDLRIGRNQRTQAVWDSKCSSMQTRSSFLGASARAFNLANDQRRVR